MAATGDRDHTPLADTEPFETVTAEQPRSFRRTWLPTIRFALLCFALWMGIRAIAPSYAIEGDSMWPTYHDGGRVILNGAYRFQSADYNDVVVFDPPFRSDKPYIKRIIGLGGDLIEIRDGAVFRNGEQLDEPYLDGVMTTCHHAPFCSLTVPDGMVYVLGDNRPNSSDSRAFGPIDKDDILGKVMFSFWPLSDIP